MGGEGRGGVGRGREWVGRGGACGCSLLILVTLLDNITHSLLPILLSTLLSNPSLSLHCSLPLPSLPCLTVPLQICLYLLSRITFGFARVAMAKGLVPTPTFNTFPWFAGLMWGCVLWLFEYERHTLQPSLQSSMTYIYQDSQLWHNVWDLLVYNTLPQ